jgi:molybdopterin/thiamine biosynthesis adenylyltransferase
LSGDAKGNNRFSEQLKLSGFSEYNQRRLASGRVLICGAGAVAQVVALNMLNVGLGSIKIISTELSRLNNLATVLAPSQGEGDDSLTFELISEYPLGDGNRPEELLRDCQIVVDGLFGWREKLELSDMCMQYRKPLVHAGGGGLRYQLFSMVPGRSACLRCVLSMVDMEDFTHTRKEEGSLYAMDSLVGSYLALEVVKLVGKVGASQGNELFKIDGLSGEIEVLRGLDRNEDCPDCGILRAGL